VARFFFQQFAGDQKPAQAKKKLNTDQADFLQTHQVNPSTNGNGMEHGFRDMSKNNQGDGHGTPAVKGWQVVANASGCVGTSPLGWWAIWNLKLGGHGG
jgi:hypothetical protein